MSDEARGRSESGQGQAPIVVGVDGSRGSRAALKWALADAACHGNVVLAVSAYQLPSIGAGYYGPALDTDRIEELVEGCRAMIDAEVSEFAPAHPEVRVERKVVEGPAGEVLVEASQGATELVVGSRGHGGFIGLLVGSISQQCVTHASCPVVVVHASDKGES